MLEVVLKSLNKFTVDLKLFLEKKFEIYSLETADKLSYFASVGAVFLVIGALSVLTLNYLLKIVTILINHFISIPAAGETIVFLSLILVLSTIVLRRNRISNRIKNNLISNYLHEGSSIKKNYITDKHQEKLNKEDS
jgi:hypothetical protein